MRSEIHVGNTTTFRLPFRGANGRPFTLTGGTITIYLTKPDGVTELTKTGTLYNATEAEYTTLTSDLDTAGDWLIQARYVNGAVQLYSDKVPFKVYGN